jgi:hypothetical protein
MKKIILFTMLLILSSSSFSQQTNSQPALSKQDYLKKSKNQKTAAWVMLGGGVALGAGGILWALSDIFSTSSGPDILFFAGGASMLGSIPLFIASSRNKKKAMSLSFKNEMVPSRLLSGQKTSFVSQLVPSLFLKISL